MFDQQIINKINEAAAQRRANGEEVDHRQLIVPVQQEPKDGPPTIPPKNVPYPFH